ncbi:hypothetical protein MRX96_023911 [Rhipicephalus microplus]
MPAARPANRFRFLPKVSLSTRRPSRKQPARHARDVKEKKVVCATESIFNPASVLAREKADDDAVQRPASARTGFVLCYEKKVTRRVRAPFPFSALERNGINGGSGFSDEVKRRWRAQFGGSGGGEGSDNRGAGIYAAGRPSNVDHCRVATRRPSLPRVKEPCVEEATRER